MSKDYQALYNKKCTQYKNAKKQIESLKEEIKELRSSKPVSSLTVDKIKDRLNTIRQTPPDEIIDNDDHINEVLREEKLEKERYLDRSHEWFVKISKIMWEVSIKTSSNYKWQTFTTAMAHGPASRNQYTDNMKEKINNWYENNKSLCI